MASEKDIRKKEKKLKKFQDATQTPTNRIKFLAEYTERCTDFHECDATFKAHHFEVIQLSHDFFVAYDLQAKKGKTNEAQMGYLLSVLKQAMLHLQAILAQRTGARTFRSMLEVMLAPTQKHSLRTAALEILLLFYEALGEPEKEFVALLPNALDLTPFLADFPADTKFRHKPSPSDATVLVPRDSKSPYTKEESLDMVNIFLKFITDPSRLDKFQHWFGMLKANVIPTLYPAICRQLGVLDAADDTGFVQNCPHEIQASLIDFLRTWVDRDDLCAFLWSGEQAALMLEIYRQACLMPATRHESIKKAFLVFKDCLLTKVPETIPENRLVSFRRWYWEQLTFIVPETPLTQDHYKIIAEALNLYDSVVMTMWPSLSPQVQEIVLLTALDLATRAIKRPDSGGVDRNLCPVLVEALLLLWINARVVDPNLWRALQERLRTFFHRKDAIVQCKYKLIQLTLVLENFMFTFEAFNKYEAKKAKQQTKRSDSQYPDPVITFDARADPVIKEKDWDWNSAQLVWFNILEVFRYTNGLEDPGAYLESIDALTTAAEMILSAYERSDFEEPELPVDAPPGSPPPMSPSAKPSLSLISIFGPWLFEAAKRPIVYAEGKALANRTLCRMVVRQSHVNLPLPLLAHFYDCVQTSLLEFSCSKVAWSILEHSTAIFSLGLPGSNILIPYFITEINKIFTKVDHIAEKVRESALTIISSLICMPHHFHGLSIPFDVEIAKTQKLAEVIPVPGVGVVPPPVAQGTNPQAGLSYADLKYRVANLLVLVVTKEPKPQLVCQAVSAINTFILAEINSPDANSGEVVMSLIKTIITCSLKEHRVSHTALSCLSGLASSYQKLHVLDPMIISRICYQLVLNISMRQLASGMELTMVSHYDALSEWLMTVPPSLFEDLKLMKKTFAAIEIALRNLDVTGPASSAPAQRDMSASLGAKDAPAPGASDAAAVGSRQRLRRAVEQLLIFLSNFANNWPLDRHYDMLQSQITDYIDEGPDAKPAASSSVSSAAPPTVGTPTPSSTPGTSSTPTPGETGDEPAPPLPPGVEAVAGPASVSPYVKDTLWYTMNEKHLISVVDVPSHEQEILDSNEHQALAYCVGSTHYIYFFKAFLRQHQLSDAIALYYEDQQYLATQVDRTDVHARMLALVRKALASPLATTAPPEKLEELTSRSTQSAEVQVWYLLYVCFGLFKASPYFASSQAHRVRLTTRDSSGKFAWDLRAVDEWDTELEIKKTTKDARNSATLNEGNFDILSAQTWRWDDVSENQEPQQKEIPDFEALLTTFQENPFKNSPDFFVPKQLTNENHGLMLEYSEVMNQQRSFVEAKIKERAAEPNVVYACEPPTPSTLLSSTHLTRRFLRQFGWLNASKYGHFTLIDKETARFKRLIKQFDTSTYGHEVTKIGLVYVKDGQENERSMLRNEQSETSALYNEFVEGMATIVTIAKHCAYVGGLDRAGTTGFTMPYWRNPSNELVVHEVTRMPTVHKDPQQIFKKRHVGNDIVHVVWTEHCRDYKPHTIVSQFNDAHIIIFPLPNGLFRIRVAQKREVSPFGPLTHNMTVPKHLLSFLARQTAVTANSVVRFSHEHYMGQFAARKNVLTEIVTKNPKQPYHEFVSSIFGSNETI